MLPASPGDPPAGWGQPWGESWGPEPDDPPWEGLLGEGLLDPGLPPDDGCGGNGDSLPLAPSLELGLELGLPPELDGDEDGEELGGCGVDGDCDVVAQPARTIAQATAHSSRTVSDIRMNSSLRSEPPGPLAPRSSIIV